MSGQSENKTSGVVGKMFSCVLCTDRDSLLVEFIPSNIMYTGFPSN